MVEPNIFDAKKVTKLLDTINDFIIGTKLTNAEIDYVLNHLWMSIQSSRVAVMALEKLPYLMIPVMQQFADKAPPETPPRPGYIN